MFRAVLWRCSCALLDGGRCMVSSRNVSLHYAPALVMACFCNVMGISYVVAKHCFNTQKTTSAAM